VEFRALRLVGPQVVESGRNWIWISAGRGMIADVRP